MLFQHEMGEIPFARAHHRHRFVLWRQ